jgi:prepilin-type N-terminal cleavage/methylation domain-containing protein
MNNKKPNGFTIVETIVSIAIVGILAASVVTTVLGKSQIIESNNGGGTTETNTGTTVLNQTQTVTNDKLSDLVAGTLETAGLQAEAKTVSMRMELRIIQTAIDLMMVKDGLQSVKETAFTSDMSKFPTGNPLYPKYVRESTTQYKYSCTTSGEVNLVTE